MLKRFKIDGLNSNVYNISIVDSPAIDESFIALSKEGERQTVMLESEEQRMLYGAVLVPDLAIYRNGENYGYDYDFEIVFSKEAIKQLSQKYMRELNNKNWTEQHENDVEGVWTCESWIKSDPLYDKSIALGLSKDLPVGSWIIGAKIDNDETWQKIKRGDFHGFSVEAFCSLKEFDFNSELNNIDKMDKKETFFEKLKNIFNEVFESEEQVVEQQEQALEAEEKVDEEQIEKPEEPVAEEAEVVEEEATEETAEDVEAKANLESENNELKAKVEELQSQLEQLLQKNVELAKQNEKLSAQPSAKPINAKSEKKGDVMDIIRSLHDGTYHK